MMSNDAPRFVMIGGFLGAGKTTTIARLAQHYRSLGEHVAIVTNDQAADLVDTHLLRSQGFDVGEVAGSCFCCNFDGLTGTVEKLEAAQRPDVILAEPVGSCTDLVATVIRPLEKVYERPFDIAPFGVIVKPSHGMKILRRSGKGGFSPQAEYIFRKQLEEADFILLNRIDELPASEIAELSELLEAQFPGRPLLKISARTGEGFTEFVELLAHPGEYGRQQMEVDYDVYAEGEAELGWLNAQVLLTAANNFALDEVLVGLLERLQQRLRAIDAETAHLKLIGMWEGHYGVSNLVSNQSEPTLSLPSRCTTHRAELVVNARVAIDPEQLADLVREELAHEALRVSGHADIKTIQSFRPGRPVPTHRM